MNDFAADQQAMTQAMAQMLTPEVTEREEIKNYIFYTSVEEVHPDYFKLKDISGRFRVNHNLKVGDKITMYITRSEEGIGVIG